MKKLRLKELKLGELLTREQMKNVVGGYGPGDCVDGCSVLNPCPELHPYCLTTSCTDKNGVLHYVTFCSPTQE